LVPIERLRLEERIGQGLDVWPLAKDEVERFAAYGVSPSRGSPGVVRVSLIGRRKPRFFDLSAIRTYPRIEEVGVAAGDTELCLTGETLDGIPIEGCDTIVTVPYVGERWRFRVNR
jgi:hypothetical protein